MLTFLGKEIPSGRSENMSSKETQMLLKKIFEEYKVKDVELTATSIIDTTIGDKRNKVVKKWLEKHKYFSSINIKSSSICDEKTKTKLQKNINSKNSKEARKVNVVINLEKEVLDLEMDYYDKMNDVIIKEAKKTSNNSNDNPMVAMALSNIKEEAEKNKIIEKMENGFSYGNKGLTNVYNEYEFFQAIDNKDNFLRNKIKDKIKYFDPAFHAITPEGFNARLTFLQQCTRQGSTYSALYEGRNVRNLAFGKPPICVLRIGDFFNTKIVIDSVNIRYDETTWDLNDEGIGVMPMFAQVDISFNFIGGSELSNAVNILQNAVTFNYYANTSVYEKNAKNGAQKK